MGIIKSKFRRMEEFDCSMDDVETEENKHSAEVDPRSPTSLISRTPLPEPSKTTTSLITRATNLTNISSTPINNHDLLLIQDKRFKHLAYNFIDPRSPSEGIVRTPIVIKSSDISSIVNTPRILEMDEMAEREGEEEEDFQKTFVERISKLSFDDCLDHLEEVEEEAKQKPDLIETRFDCLDNEEKKQADAVQPLKPRPLASVIAAAAAQSTLDPRSPTIGINRSPLVFGEPKIMIKPTEEEEEEKEETKEEEEKNEEKETISIEGVVVVEKKKAPAIVNEDVGRNVIGTPMQITGTTTTQLVRTPLSCLANRKRGGEANGGKSPMVSNIPVKQNIIRRQKGQQQEKVVPQQQAVGLRVNDKSAAFENTTPRKMIR